MHKIIIVLASAVLSSAAQAASSGTPADISGIEIPHAQSAGDQKATLMAVRAFYDFWNTGDKATLGRAIAANFVDHTPPPGRAPGPQGPLLAARQFLGAVPDLHVTVTHMIVAGPYVTVHMHFDGHFTGIMNGRQGNGQVVHFIATDLLKVTDARITDNWHLEDNLALLGQMGLVGPR